MGFPRFKSARRDPGRVRFSTGAMRLESDRRTVVLPRIGVVNNAAALNFEPVAVLVMAWVLLGQGMAPLQIFGSAIVIGAIVALSTGKR